MKLFALLDLLCATPLPAADLHLNDQDYFESQGLSILACHNKIHL
jgi:hypothetical protein